IVPPVILQPVPLECECKPHEEQGDHRHSKPGGKHEHSSHSLQSWHELKHPLNNEYSDQCGKKRKKYWLHGDFLIHCHVEMHMMEGMAAVLRATQEVELSDEELNSICYPLPTVHVHQCPEVDHHPCSGDG